jgi:hypothetical protein
MSRNAWLRGRLRTSSRRRRARRTGAPSPALRALTGSALALSGVAGGASADTPIERITTDYNFSQYREDDLDRSKGLPLGETSRYEVDMHQFILRAPVPWTDRVDFGLELVHETMSGASPWYIVPDAAGAPIQVMSGATIEDERNDLLFNMNYYYENARLGFGGGFSDENDYSAMNFSIDGETHFNEKNTTLSGGLGVSFDEIEPTDSQLFTTRPESEEKKSYSVFVGLAQLLSRRSLVQSSLSYRFSDGYLSDPYKQMFVVGGIFRPDSRPDTRHQFAWLTRFRRHVEELDGTFHLDYQFHIDTWDVNAHSIEIAWHQTVWDALRIVPSARWYSQSEADFYVPYFTVDPGPGEYSADYRLSAYGALRVGVKAEYTFRTPWTGDIDWRGSVAWERYISSSDFSHADASVEAPGLVDYDVLTFGFSVRY